MEDARAELRSWMRLAQLRQASLNVHPHVTLAHYNHRFGTVHLTWASVEKDASARLHPGE